MKQISKILSIAAIFAIGALTIGCNSLKEELEVPGTEPVSEKTITVTAMVGLDTSTKALTAAGVKTFAAGETIAVFYTNTSDALVKTTYTFTAGDLIDGGRKASITVSMTAPKAGGAVKYIYPNAMAKADGTVNYAALATQDGTLATLAANFDLATYDGTLTGEAALPASVTLSNDGEDGCKCRTRVDTGGIAGGRGCGGAGIGGSSASQDTAGSEQGQGKDCRQDVFQCFHNGSTNGSFGYG